MKLVYNILFTTVLGLAACKRLIEVPAPVTSINAGNVYTNDATAAAVLTNVYANLSAGNSELSISSLGNLFLSTSLAADELSLYNLNNDVLLAYYRNDLNNKSPDFWTAIYPVVAVANISLESLNQTNTLTPAIKQQLMGEALFMRAFCYFQLVNLYGDVALVTSTNYKLNATLSRTGKEEIYKQLIADLKTAQNLLSDHYLAADILTESDARVRPTLWAATALLARAYLYTGAYQSADEEASKVINHTALFELPLLNNVFLQNSPEAIWQLQPVGANENSNTGEGKIFVLPNDGPDNANYPVYLNDSLVKDFEPGDQRKQDWVNSVTVNNHIYYYPYKYKVGRVIAPTSEYIMMLRLAEQYLIRAEARAHLGNLSGAADDLNRIRNRAGLKNTTANNESALLTAIQQERKIELFTEWGHRWFDLKRTNTINKIMSVETPLKGGVWRTTAQLFPIPLIELQRDRNLTQNVGY